MERLASKIAFSSRAQATLESVRLAVRPIKMLFVTIQTSNEAATMAVLMMVLLKSEGGVNSELVPGKKLPGSEDQLNGGSYG